MSLTATAASPPAALQQQVAGAPEAAAPAPAPATATAAAGGPQVISLPSRSRAAAPGSKLGDRGTETAAAEAGAAASPSPHRAASVAAAPEAAELGETGKGDSSSNSNSSCLRLPSVQSCDFDRSLRPDLDVHLLLKGQPTPLHPRQQQHQQQQQQQQQHGECGTESPAYVSDCGAELGALPSVASLSGTLGSLIREHAAKEAGAAAADTGTTGEQDLHSCPNCHRPLLLCPSCLGRSLQLNLRHGKVVLECVTCSITQTDTPPPPPAAAAAAVPSTPAAAAACGGAAAAAPHDAAAAAALKTIPDGPTEASETESPAAATGTTKSSSSSSSTGSSSSSSHGVYTHCWECQWDFTRSAELLGTTDAAIDGVLLKKGKHLHQWQARFYVLIDNMLYYYKKKVPRHLYCSRWCICCCTLLPYCLCCLHSSCLCCLSPFVMSMSLRPLPGRFSCLLVPLIPLGFRV